MNESWITQLKRGTLEYGILIKINKKDCYGYELIQSFNKFPLLNTKESTIYPLLRRLEKNSYLESYWKEVTEGTPPRKYYCITKNGKKYLEYLDKDWKLLINNLKELEEE